ncbi:hypothetical protein SF06_31650 [Pseudomonas flexibilis]|nr:hypothetical protein SF06_31650 [Pseudomonas flexibilis]
MRAQARKAHQNRATRQLRCIRVRWHTNCSLVRQVALTDDPAPASPIPWGVSLVGEPPDRFPWRTPCRSRFN